MEEIYLLTKHNNRRKILNEGMKKHVREWSLKFQGKKLYDFLECFQSHSYKKVIIHGDLTASNIIYSEKKKRVNRIIDFTDAQIGDPAFNFAGLYWSFGPPNFTKDVLLSCYKTLESLDSIFNIVSKFYGLQPVFHELLYAIRNNQKVNWGAALDRFSYLYTKL